MVISETKEEKSISISGLNLDLFTKSWLSKETKKVVKKIIVVDKRIVNHQVFSLLLKMNFLKQ